MERNANGGEGLPIRSRSGRRFVLRRICEADAEPLQRAFHQMSPQDKHARTFSQIRELSDEMTADFIRLDRSHDICVVIEDPEQPGEIFGGARFMGDAAGGSGEFAVSLRPDAKGEGLARQALAHVLAWARGHGFAEAWGSILASNWAMLGLAKRLGFTLRRDPDDPGLMVATLALAALRDGDVPGGDAQPGGRG